MITLDDVEVQVGNHRNRKVILEPTTLRFPDQTGLALIGRNGAGQSTLLRVISGSLEPSRGRILSDESISWPMGFAGGFHPALTGAQNAQFIARLYGKDVREFVDFVQGFSELGKAYHQPVDVYSQGMKARLAFAASIGVEFDCYLVDEIIGVGDAAFRRKCQIAFRERLRGSRLIMVSHNPKALLEFCDAALVIENGRLEFHRTVEAALEAHAIHLMEPSHE